MMKRTIKKCNEKFVPVSKYKVAILGDRHLKGSAPRIDKYLSSKFEVSGFTKPGASFEKIVGVSNLELSKLTKMCLYVMVVPMISTLVTQRE